MDYFCYSPIMSYMETPSYTFIVYLRFISKGEVSGSKGLKIFKTFDTPSKSSSVTTVSFNPVPAVSYIGFFPKRD